MMHLSLLLEKCRPGGGIAGDHATRCRRPHPPARGAFRARGPRRARYGLGEPVAPPLPQPRRRLCDPLGVCAAGSYDMAKLFTHVSLVWYNLKSDGNKLVLEGHRNYDAEWVSELQSNGSLVVPRVVLEAFPGVVLLKKKPPSFLKETRGENKQTCQDRQIWQGLQEKKPSQPTSGHSRGGGFPYGLHIR